MPRKQRFKPSRKPKPNPQTEEHPIGHPTNHPDADQGGTYPRDSYAVGQDLPAQSDLDPRSH
jgi:hypothetical protein